MFSLLSFLSLVLILSISFAEESKRLLLVQSLFRHGDRAPMFLYPKDPNKVDSWPEGLGKLTQLGRKQHYAVGKFLRSMYKDFVTSNPNEVSAISSATERSMSSAQAHLAAFYAPEGRWKFEDELNWQPIPIYAIPLKDDKYLSYNSTCAKSTALYHEICDSFQMTEGFRKHQILLETLTPYVGYNLSEGINAFPLIDILMVEKNHNLSIPDLANTHWDELVEIVDIIFRHIFSLPKYIRLRVGPLLQKLTETMTKKIDGETPDLKVQIFSGHDVNVGGVLIALNFTDISHPPYCATLLFELHEMTDASKAIRLLYLNSTDPLQDIGKPQILVLDDCSEFCPIETFIKKIQHWIPDNWEQECELDTSDACETDRNCENIRPVHKPDEL